MTVLGNANRTAAISPRATPAEQGLARAESPLQVPVNGQLGALVDQSVAGNVSAQAQLAAFTQQMAQSMGEDMRPVRGSLDSQGRSPRPEDQPMPSLEQFQQMELASMQQQQLAQAQLMGQMQPAPQAPAAPQLPPFVPTLPGQPSMVTAPQPVAPQAAPAQSEFAQAFAAMAESQRQQAALMQQFIEMQTAPAEVVPQRPMTQQEQFAQAREDLRQQGFTPQQITGETLIAYVATKQNAELQQRILDIEAANTQRWSELQNHAQTVRMARDIESTTTAALAQYASVPDATRTMVSSYARQLAQAGVPVEQAVGQAIEGVKGLLAQRAAPQPAAPAFPTFAAPQQFPQFAVPGFQGMNPAQIAAQQQAMAAAAMQGAGAGRYQPQTVQSGPSLEAMDRMFLQLGN